MPCNRIVEERWRYNGSIPCRENKGLYDNEQSQSAQYGVVLKGKGAFITYVVAAGRLGLGKDDSGKAKFACMRSIGGNLKKDVYGSDKGYNFCYPPQSPGSRHVAVFEAPIDALSHATLQELEGWKWNGYRLSLGGTSHVALTSFLERHPEIRCVTLYMDHDLAGFVNARKIKTMLHEDKRFRHIRVSVNPPRMGKDYNEKLLQVREQLQTSQHQRRPKEAAVSI